MKPVPKPPPPPPQRPKNAMDKEILGMTQDNDRLAQVEALLLQLSTAVVRHDNQLEQIGSLVAENARTTAANAQAIASMRESQNQLIGESLEWFGQIFTRIDEMQSEVRGLQTENRRILERLEQMSNGH